jgi:hypothetical protein
MNGGKSKMNFKLIILSILPIVTYIENYYRNKDANDTGKDDKTAKFLNYTRKGLTAIAYDTDLPDAPAELSAKA